MDYSRFVDPDGVAATIVNTLPITDRASNFEFERHDVARYLTRLLFEGEACQRTQTNYSIPCRMLTGKDSA